MISRFYRFLAERLALFAWGRVLLGHVRRHQGPYERAEALLTALVFVVLLKTFLVDAYEIPSRSMLDTLQVDDRILVNKLVYRLRPVEIGDIIVFEVPDQVVDRDPDKPYFIKRVVGLPGDRVEIGSDGYIYRNGERLQEPDFFATNYYFWQLTAEPYEFTRSDVPEGHVLVFGDNSVDSYDSRYWGAVPLDNIVGRAFFRYWPVSPWRIGTIRDVPPSRRTLP